MTALNFRSLLLAAIVLSNCITWTASRHHYAHNVHQHRTRHRRQGAGLYLPASYVIPGGEGDGPWGEWGEVSPCSRTCGGGVASQKRICLQPGPEGQSLCTGGDTKYFSCQTQDCPDGSGDFRAEQCAEFNDKAFRGFKYNWVPYTKAPNPCELNCMPHGERFYFRHKLQVTDGTRCDDESFDVCVNGRCQPVGCDMMLNSTAREDKCRECRGNGANCRTTEDIIDTQELMKGYNDILLIPAGSTSINIEEVAPSNNYLALRAKNGTYYLNGHYHIDFPRSIMIAGALWSYERSQQGFAAPDKLRCLGPTNEPLYLSLLLQDENVGIRYEYSVPNNSAPPTDKRYNWAHEEFTPCSATCGGGFQTRNVTCRSREELELVEDSLCDEGLRPPTNQSCSPEPCPAQWEEGPWGECSQRCGSGGVRSREVTCQKIIANGIKSIVPDKECFDLLGPKPEVFQKCNEDAPCPTWFVGHWKPCDKLCDEGKQTRQVVCYQKKDGRIKVLDEKDCTEKKPDVEQTCMLQPCDGVDWVVSGWSGCDSCTSKNRTRVVVCSTKGREVLDDNLCSYHKRPVDHEECNKDELPDCEVQWYATQWGKCSVKCGDGVQTRKVFCGMYNSDDSGDGVEVVDDAKCANLTKYQDTKPCTVPKEECPSQWFAGPWTECTKECGGGEQYRRVMCYRGDKEAADCDPTTVLDSTQLCNTGPCDPDHLLPVSRSSTVVMGEDEDEECEDEDYEEVGVDFLTTMMSDSPSPGYAEHESTLETGTDWGSSLSTDDLTTEDGSGFSTIESDYTTDDYYTGSGDTSTTDVPSSPSASKDKDTSTTTTVIPPTEREPTIPGASASDETSATGATESTPTADTISTSSDTGFTSSSDSDGTGSTTEAETGSTASSLSTDTKETGSTSESDSTSSGETSTGETSSTDIDKTESTIPGGTDVTSSSGQTESTVSEKTGPTESTITDETSPTDSTVTERTESTETTVADKTVSTETTVTEETGSTESTVTDKTESTVTEKAESTVAEETGSTESTVTEKTESTVTKETESTVTEKTESTVTEETESTVTEKTESTVTEETESTVTEKTESTVTEETESTVTEKTESTVTEETESTVTEKTESTVTEETGSTVSEKTGLTESTITEETSPTDSTITERTESTESTVAEETGSTESTVTEKTESTESTTTDKSGSTESTIMDKTGSTVTEKVGSTESTVTDASESSITSESDTTGTTNIEETSDTTGTSTGSTDGKASTEEPSTPLSTESSTDSSETTVETGSSTVESSTTSESDKTTEAGSTISTELTTEGAESSSLGAETSTPSETESTTAAIESSSLASGSTDTESSTSSKPESFTETTESGSSVGSVSTAEGSESSTEESSTVSGETSTGESSTGSSTTPGSTGSEESTIYSTTEATTSQVTTEESGSTELSTTEGTTGTTIWSKTTVFVPAKKICKPRKCSRTKFGCCPDKKTTALGPFDEGCLKPRTCKSPESTYGCCPDGLSLAQGPNNEGCPVEPCADTLFGCCTSDNKTAAQGNDQDGCPPPPPPCASSEYGCCADNETEATGPEKEGCPETQTSTTGALTETTTETTESSGTESSETSEGSTTNEGTTDVIGTTTLDPCSGFQFGCCADNETEASGPDGQGCPCNATEYGCCPDGVSPASGLDNEGCPGPCSSSPHGCCQDGKTPAHGPEYEGCCLLQAFGCCPDNRKPAEGPHLEGCGCQNALHGCCPDNVTIAQGPDNQGCGCQYTQHGCCPDRHTAASGPNNEGCACNTYQFGCCADGVTTAKGPEQQGCHCRESTFGCCGDGETPATGPDAAGCDCSSSRHGCCPDGRTEAAGPKFLGCTDAPENKQAACSMSTDPGPCHNFTAMWYYDLAYGGCSRFWYGGCDGNGNRFATKEECEDVCVQPSPKDACKLPSVKGACDADYQRWHYNSTREQCIPFRYGGCLGNANNFDSRELCQKQCEPTSVADQCSLPIDQGSCAGNYSRWGFNSEAHRCEQFIWGGCEGNSNRFSSEAACQMRCTGTQPPQCTQPQEAGNCAEKEALWSFSQSENRCLPFYYSGCGGNDNRFGSREACEQTCPSAYVPDKCTLPAETGQCSNYRQMWFYDTTWKRCRQFYYGGCGGNENNFATEAECENSCAEIKTTTTTTTTTTARPVEPQPQTQRPDEPEPRPPAPERSEFCFNAIDAGPCNNTETRFAYDSELGRCVTFQYGGCGGNQNNFPDESYCSFYCQPMQDICQLPMMQGPCEDSLMRWFYDPTSDSCSQFAYGGCEGNDNRFESLEACENRCRTGPAPVPPTTPSTTAIVNGPPECIVAESLEQCRYGGVVWYFDPHRRECVSHANQEAGAACRHTGTFSSEEACQRSCGAFLGVDVCKQPKDPGPCQSYVTKVYFDQSTGQCHEFSYGGCLGGANRFSSIEECSQVCKTEIQDPCSLPPEQGNCFLYVQQWYYDPSRDQCNQFVYTGCSGNDNRFETQYDCEARCKRPPPTTTTVATPPQQPGEPECKTPSSLAPCGNNVTVFYYDAERGQCLVSGFGGCGHPNSYRSEEECERRCGAFRGADVCGARLDPGPCRASIPKIYWDALSGSCQQYAYGGCAGGPNRFSSVEDCMNVCGDTGPARACLQAAHVGQRCGAAPGARWHYRAAHGDCVVFAYLGCGGNDNNFHSYEHCADVCRVSRTSDDCTPYQQECEALDCQYGVERFTQDGCQRCNCKEDPCVRANCQSNERCVAIAIRDSGSQEPTYSARCVFDSNDIFQCDEYVANCSRLRCEYGIQRARLPDGCEKCSCVQVEIDCEPLKQECNELKCNYGIERTIGPDGCERCKCKEYPCERKSCASGERCVVHQYMNGLDLEPQFTAECRTIVKPGACPVDETTTNEVSCRRECADDADCRGVGKCCRRGCSDICLVPVEQTSPHPLLTTTIAPNVPAAPIALPPQEPDVKSSEGGTVTLRCLFHGNPPPKITWRFGEVTIDGNAGRYRLTSEGALEIVSLYRNDTGVYICVADNGLGTAMQEIHLLVNDPVRMPVGIAGDENAVVTGELGQPLHVRCLAYGYPPPSVFWYRGYEGAMVPYNDAVYEARGNVLLIRSLAIETLGQYTCQAYNGEGKAASWVVFVRAYMPDGFFIENEYLVPRNTLAPRPRTQPPTTAESTTTTTSTTTELTRPIFTVPVSTHVSTPFSTLNIGTDLRLTCEVDGFPEPDVHWTKDGANIQTDGRITITGSTIVSRLTVSRVSVADSGLYACHASNPYSSQSDTAQINVQNLVVPAKCTDNPFFANCDLIVRSKFCRHKYYSKFCCKSCVEAGQLDPQEAELQADQPVNKK